METPPRLRMTNSALQEITRRAAKSGQGASGKPNQWAQYLLLLVVINGLLDRVPESSAACNDVEIEVFLANELAQLIEAIHDLMPGGILEIISYLPPEKRRAGWGSGMNW